MHYSGMAAEKLDISNLHWLHASAPLGLTEAVLALHTGRRLARHLGFQ